MGRRTLKIMDYRLVIIIFTIYLTKGVLGLDCYAMKCSYNTSSEMDEDCVSLGDLTDANSTSCAFYPCMKATGRELIDGVATDIRIYYCGHDANYKNVCDFEDDCDGDDQAFTFKPSVPFVNGTVAANLTEVTEIYAAEVCCCSSGDQCNGSGLMEESSASSLSLNSLALLLAAVFFIR